MTKPGRDVPQRQEQGEDRQGKMERTLIPYCSGSSIETHVEIGQDNDEQESDESEE